MINVNNSESIMSGICSQADFKNIVTVNKSISSLKMTKQNLQNNATILLKMSLLDYQKRDDSHSKIDVYFMMYNLEHSLSNNVY